jgi:DNA repair protein RecO (recombination protein O)
VALYRDQGVVLRTYKLGEADRIVVMATRGRGKVRAVAKGVRRTSSRFGSRLEPGSHVAAQFYEGRELDIVTQVESLDHFRVIREDLHRVARAQVLLEAVDQVLQESEPNPRTYQTLLGALRSLEADDPALLVAGFLFKLLALEGVRPEVEACVDCGRTDELVAFDPGSGGMLCVDCRRGMAVSAEAHGFIVQILGGQLGAALNEPESAATHQVDAIAASAIEFHLERRLRSLVVLDRT